MSDCIHPILFCLLNSASTCVVILVGGVAGSLSARVICHVEELESG